MFQGGHTIECYKVSVTVVTFKDTSFPHEFITFYLYVKSLQ